MATTETTLTSNTEDWPSQEQVAQALAEVSALTTDQTTEIDQAWQA